MVVEVRAIGAYNVIAIYSGTKGGTRNTIEYAMQKGIEIYYAKGGKCHLQTKANDVRISNRADDFS